MSDLPAFVRLPGKGYPPALAHARRMRAIGFRLVAEQAEALHEVENACPVCTWVHEGPVCTPPPACDLCPMGHAEPHQGPVLPWWVRWPQTFDRASQEAAGSLVASDGRAPKPAPAPGGYEGVRIPPGGLLRRDGEA